VLLVGLSLDRNSPLKMLIIITLLPKFEQRKAPAFADA
jgi:hypothetical protein